jgi:hypothetical protein
LGPQWHWTFARAPVGNGIPASAVRSNEPGSDRRNRIAGQMIEMLENAAFNGQEIDEGQARLLINEAQDLLNSNS